MAEAPEPNGDFETFLEWEGATRDTIDFKVAYVDMAGDVMAGLLLSQIVYWYLPNRKGQSKLRVQKGEHFWIVRSRDAWWDEIRLTARQVDRALQILKGKGLIETVCHRFAGTPTTHVRICKGTFLRAWQAVLKGNPISPNGEITDSLNRDGTISPNGEMDIDETLKSLTETTAETTSSETTISPPSAENPSEPASELPETENPHSVSNGFAGFGEGEEDRAASTGDYLGDVQRRASRGASWTVPPEAGGADSFKDGPVDAFCALVGISREHLTDKEVNDVAKLLRQVGERKGVDAQFVADSIAMLPESDWDWRCSGFTQNPHAGGFEGILCTLIGRRLSGQPIRKKETRAGPVKPFGGVEALAREGYFDGDP